MHKAHNNKYFCRLLVCLWNSVNKKCISLLSKEGICSNRVWKSFSILQKIFVSDISNHMAGQPWPTRHRLKAPILEQNHLWIKQAMLSIKNQDYEHTFKFSFQEMHVLKSCCYTFLTTTFLLDQFLNSCPEVSNSFCHCISGNIL